MSAAGSVSSPSLPLILYTSLSPETAAVLLTLGQRGIRYVVFARYDEWNEGQGYEARRTALLAALARCREPRDLALLPPNDLAGDPEPHELGEALREAGAFRADMSGAGPAVYGLFERREEAELAALAVEPSARVWALRPVW